MAGGKETPRQKMIGMMYLVLTALLALNVSKEILNSFVLINDSLEVTNQNFTGKNQSQYSAFDAALATNLEGLTCPELTGLTLESIIADPVCADPNDCSGPNDITSCGAGTYHVCFVFKVLFIFIISQISHCLFIIT